MEKTLFIASFPDLGSLDFSKTSFRIGNIDNSEYFFMSNDSNYVHSYINSLKNMAGDFDIVFVPATDNIISMLRKDNIKCIVLYPNISCKDSFIESMRKSGIEDSYISMVEDSWDFIISRLDKKDYDFKFVMGEDDNVLDVLQTLCDKRDVLGVGRNDVDVSISDHIVDDIFSYCLLTENEFVDGKPTIQSTYCEGIKFDYLFSTKRLNDKKESISSLIDSIDAVEDGVSVSLLGKTKDGKEWTNSIDTLEKVMVLGVSNGDLIIPFSRDLDKSLKGSVPYVIKTETLVKEVRL